MIAIKRYKAYWDHCKDEVPAIKKVILVVNEAQLGKKVANLKKSEYPALIALVPSSDPASFNEDNVADVNSSLIFILHPASGSNETDEKYLDDMETSQNAMVAVRELMLADKSDCSSSYHDVMQRLDVNSWHLDPEYNLLAHNGWSLSFSFKTPGV